MATIKIFTSQGVKELKCFDNYDEVDYLELDLAADQDPEAAEEDQ